MMLAILRSVGAIVVGLIVASILVVAIERFFEISDLKFEI